jgi:hypothetical protein
MTPTTPATEARRVRGHEAAIGGNVRLLPGGAVELLNVSATGALVESKHRLATGTSVVMVIEGDRPQRLQGSVVRSTVTAIHRDSTMTYQLGIAFNPDSKLEGVLEEPEPAPAATAAVDVDAAIGSAGAEALVNQW